MNRLLAHPKKVYAFLVVSLAATFALAGVAGDERNFAYFIGGASWIVFMVLVLTFIAYTVAFPVRRLRGQPSVSTSDEAPRPQ